MVFSSLAKKVFGSANERMLKKYYPVVSAINALEPQMQALSDAELAGQTAALRQKLAQGATEDTLLPEAFATVREAAKRVLGQRHYDVQLMGGMVLHEGMISEMRTGEGKTLVSTLPAYLNALSGKGVHIVTVNDYLASRDAEWMGRIYRFLGLSVGCIVHGLTDQERRAAYGADITYGTNNEYGFDYLRDNMKFDLAEMVQRPFNFAIVDEVDSILIDEARTPLIISGPTEDRSELYVILDKYIPKLKPEHYELEEKHRSITFTEEGTHFIEALLKKDKVIDPESNLYDANNIQIVHHLNQALRAHKLFTLDKDYIVKDRKVIIIDEFTGRMMEGRRYSEGQHQAIEAKENVPIQQENQTLASITFQNYFRMYPKLSGMTGTAVTEATEFADIYKLEVVEIPTNVPVARIDADDEIYRTAEEKYDAIVTLIREAYKRKQPVLVGTVSIEKSELLSRVLKKQKIAHSVLNARYHLQEAQIIAQAGQPGAVTIATNMAGRGTDIQLGGNADLIISEKIQGITDAKKIEKISADIRAQVKKDQVIVKEAGGLMVIGTERHESRRIDNQLRGRSGRQGDPGFTKFYLSLEDDLMRIFGADKKMDYVMRTLGEPGEPIAHPLLTRTLQKAQQKVELMHYEVRKNLLKFDDVMNDQRKVIFDQRIEIMQSESVEETRAEMAEELIGSVVAQHIPEKGYVEAWDIEGLTKECFRVFGLHLPIADWAKEEGIADAEIHNRVLEAVQGILNAKETLYGAPLFRDVEKRLLLYTLDELWKDHLHSLDMLRHGINLRAYAQKDPLNEYKREAFVYFQGMLDRLRETYIERLCKIVIQTSPDAKGITPLQRRPQRMQESRRDPAAAMDSADGGKVETILRKPAGPFDPNNPDTWGKVGRNDPCPCGSGKKYKHCHGVLS